MLIGLILTGPLVCASSQATNDWFDRHVDASMNLIDPFHRDVFRVIGFIHCNRLVNPIALTRECLRPLGIYCNHGCVSFSVGLQHAASQTQTKWVVGQSSLRI